MGRQIIKQPNGLYAIFSSVVDNFIMTDVTPEEYIQFRIEEESEEIKDKITKIINKLDKGEKPYYQFTMTWDEALATIKRVHGEIKDDI